MDDFNPYQTWLGLAASDLPPSHYQLLGLEPLDDDPSRITRAADAMITRVRGIRPGDNALRWKDLLDELDDAKQCLLDPDAKSQYDAQLRGTASGTPVENSVPTEAAMPGPSASPAQASAPAPQPIASPTNGPPSAPAPLAAAVPPPSAPANIPSPASPSLPAAPEAANPQPMYQPPSGLQSAPTPQPGYAPAPYQQPAAAPGPMWGQAPSQAPNSAPGGYAPENHGAMNAGYPPAASGPPAPPPPVQEETPTFDLRTSSTPRNRRGRIVGPPGEVEAGDRSAPVVAGQAIQASIGGIVPPASNSSSSRRSRVTLDKLAGTKETNDEAQFGTSSDFSGPTTPRGRRQGKSMLPYALAGSGLLLLASIITSLLVSPDAAEVAQAGQPIPAVETAPPTSTDDGDGSSRPIDDSDEDRAIEDLGPLPTVDVPVVVTEPPGGMIPSETVGLSPVTIPDEPDDPFASPEPETTEPPVPAAEPGITDVAATDPAAEPAFPDPEMALDPPDSEPPVDSAPAGSATAQEVAVVDRALAAAMKAMSLRRYSEADAQLKIAASAASDESLKQKVERIRFVRQGVKAYWEAIHDGLKNLKSTDELQIGRTTAIVVEVSPERLVLRVAGAQKEYAIENLPLGLAREFADRWFDQNASSTKAYTGAFLLVEPNGDRQEVRRLWEEAQQGGADVDYLMPLLDDSLDSLDAPSIERSPLPSAAELRAAQQALSADFRKALQAATTPAAKADLARRWMSDAENPDLDAPARYATLQAAMNVAASAADAMLVVQSADMLGEFFEVDRFDLKSSALGKAASAAQDATKQRQIAQALLELVDEAEARSDTQAKSSLLDLAAAAAAKSEDADLKQRVSERRGAE